MLRIVLSFLFHLPTGSDAVDLCDPLGEPRPSYSQEQRQDTYARVQHACEAYGASKDVCQVLFILTVRESSGRTTVRHQLPEDQRAARSGYWNAAHLYGWSVEGKGKRKHLVSEDETTASNQSYLELDRWGSTGLGPHGMIPAFHVHLWDPMAPPEHLCVPEVSTLVVLRKFRRNQARYKGKLTWLELGRIYAGRGRNEAHHNKDSNWCHRLKSKGVNCERKPKDLGKVLGKEYEEGQEEKVEEVIQSFAAH